MTTPALNHADVFHLLHGQWHLDRTIPGQATMHGQATIAPQSGLSPIPPVSSSPALPIGLSSRPKAASRPQWRDPQSTTKPASTTALYTEHVQIQTITGAQLTGTAHYLFSHRPDGDLDVHLPHTGALFHTLHFARTPQDQLEARATHLCAADTYTSTYRLLSPDHLTIEHIVRGPRKLYTSHTTLTRAPGNST